MTSIIIQNVGPVKNVGLDLKRFNFFIGRQGSGKSTIAKIISFCMWMEKEVLTHPNHKADIAYYEKQFQYQLEDFHWMHGYFGPTSHIEYHSSFIDILFTGSICQINPSKKNTYQRVKVLYVPAERSIAIRDVIQTKENNIKSFSIDFDTARIYYSSDNKLELNQLGIKYYQSTEKGKPYNRIVNGDMEYDIRLDDGSSGLQSMVPVAVVMDFYSKAFYRQDKENKTLSVAQDRDRKDVRNFIKDTINDEKLSYLMIERLLQTHRTSFVVEEPESNLFPTTQRDLLNFMIACCNGKRKHNLTVTTHSPYIINQLNLLIKAYDKETKIDGAAIAFDDLNVFAVQDGAVRDLKVKNEGVRLVDTIKLSDDINNIYELYRQL